MDKKKATDLLNLTGVFFQDYCADLLRSLTGFSIVTEEPFTFPPSNGPVPGRVGSIDVLAVYSDTWRSACFAIECKRALPSTKNWIFFHTRGTSTKSAFLVRPGGPVQGQLTSRVIALPMLGYSNPSDLELCDRVIEVNEQFSSVNKTQEEKVYRALLQANLGLRVCLLTKGQLLNRMCNASNNPMTYIPVVLTTANLYVAKFAPRAVEPKDGGLSASNVDYQEKKWVEYEFGLPDYLITKVDEQRRSTFVVRSPDIQEFFKNLALSL